MTRVRTRTTKDSPLKWGEKVGQHDWCTITCESCGNEFVRKGHSIKHNLTQNGKFKCHRCKVRLPEHREKLSKIHNKGGRKHDKKVPVTCSKCNRPYQINYRTVKQLENHGKPVICRACGIEQSWADGKYEGITPPKHDTVSKFEQETIDKLEGEFGTLQRQVEAFGFKFDAYHEETNQYFECQGKYWHSKYQVARRDYLKRQLVNVREIWEDDYQSTSFILDRMKHRIGMPSEMVKQHDFFRTSIPPETPYFYAFEIEEKRPICLSMMRGMMGQHRKVGARSLEIRPVNPDLAMKFMRGNHLFGSKSASYYLGLWDDDVLYQLASFRTNNGEWELDRLCSALNVTVVGGLSRLVSKFPHRPLKTFASKRLSLLGNGYLKAGFIHVRDTEPGYFYVDLRDGSRYSRQSMQKHKMAMKLKDFDPSLTESENAIRNGLLRVNDRGNRLFILR